MKGLGFVCTINIFYTLVRIYTVRLRMAQMIQSKINSFMRHGFVIYEKDEANEYLLDFLSSLSGDES